MTPCSTETCQRPAAVDMAAIALCAECFRCATLGGRYRVRVVWTKDHKVKRVIAERPAEEIDMSEGPVIV